MSPRLILLLWRERWGKAGSNALKTPYLKGKINQWSSQLAASSVWSWPGVTALVSMLCVLLFVLMLSVQLSLNSQIALSVFMVGISLYVRRYTGMLVTLTLMGLSLLVSTRYLYWRFTATLGPDFNWDFIFGFSLCVAELHLFLLTALRWVLTVWPLKREYTPLSDATFGWPTVDVFIPAHDQSQAAILAATKAAMALDWPRKKIHTYLLDDAHREDIQALANAMGATYLAYPDHADGRAGMINRALADSKGQLIAIFDGERPPNTDFLHLSVGWFMQDVNLGMLQTPHHFLAPAPAAHCTQIFDAPSSGGSCALIRRSMLLEVDGIESAPVTPQAHTALKLQTLGYTHAYIGFSEPPVDADKANALKVFRVDHPFLGATLRWKLRLSSFLSVLQFYYAVPRLIFFTAPVAYLLADMKIIQTSGALFFAYALPHLIQHLIAQARMQGPTRVTAWATVRETALAWYLLVRTAMTLVRTEVSRCIPIFRADKTDKAAPFDWFIALPYVSVLVLNLAGFVIGSARLPFLPPHEQEASALYLLWSAYNLLTLAAMLAIAEEARHVRLQMRAQLRVPAMIKLPSGRSVICRTENFPATALELKLPAPVAIEAGLPVSLSIFRGYQESSFPARVVAQQDMILRVAIEDVALNEYAALGMAAHSRGEDWPKWLPDRDADHPLPPWRIKPFVALYVRACALGTRFGQWIQKWKRKNE